MVNDRIDGMEMREADNGEAALSMDALTTTLSTQRPTGSWTILFKHRPYAPALWALLFDPEERVLADVHFGDQWPRISAQSVITNHVVGYRTRARDAKERLVARLEPVHRFPEAWRAFSLTRALALALAAVPGEWPIRFDASSATLARGSRYSDLMATAIAAASELATRPPRSDEEALRVLMRMSNGLNPETTLQAADGPSTFVTRGWPEDGATVRKQLLGTAVECPTSHVEAMTRARRRWEATW